MFDGGKIGLASRTQSDEESDSLNEFAIDINSDEDSLREFNGDRDYPSDIDTELVDNHEVGSSSVESEGPSSSSGSLSSFPYLTMDRVQSSPAGLGQTISLREIFIQAHVHTVAAVEETSDGELSGSRPLTE